MKASLPDQKKSFSPLEDEEEYVAVIDGEMVSFELEEDDVPAIGDDFVCSLEADGISVPDVSFNLEECDKEDFGRGEFGQQESHLKKKEAHSSPVLRAGERSVFQFFFPYRKIPTFFCPKNQHEIELHSKVLGSICFDIRAYCVWLFQNDDVRKNGRFFKCGSWNVAAHETVVPDSEIFLPCGGFYNKRTREYGTSLIDLFFHVNETSYSDGMSVLSDFYGVTDDGKDGRKPWYVPVKKHLSPPKRVCWSLSEVEGARLIAEYPYEAIKGHPHLYVSYWELQNGSKVRVYQGLFRHHKSHRLFWLELKPRAGNHFLTEWAFLDAEYDDFPIIVCDNEEQAETVTFKSKRFDSSITTACPQGMQGLPEMDLTIFSGRDVYLYCTKDILKYVPRAVSVLMHHCNVFVYLAGVPEYSNEVIISRPVRLLSGADFLNRLASFRYEPWDTKKIISNGFPKNVVIAPGSQLPGANVDRKTIIAPIVREGDICWLYANSKVGKTWVGLALAFVASAGTGSVGKWKGTKPWSVLYVDGEMLPDDLDMRIQMVKRGHGCTASGLPFHTLCAKSTEAGIVDLLDDKVQSEILDTAKQENINFIVLDNVYSLTENKVDMKPLSAFLQKLSKRKVAVLVLDHTNRDGELQGSISKERMCSLSILLESEEGSNDLTVSYPVARSLHGEDALSFQSRKVFTDDSFKLVVDEVEESSDIADVPEKIKNFAMIKFMKEEQKFSFRKISEEIDVAHQTVANRYKNQIPKLSKADSKLLAKEVERLRSNDV